MIVIGMVVKMIIVADCLVLKEEEALVVLVVLIVRVVSYPRDESPCCGLTAPPV